MDPSSCRQKLLPIGVINVTSRHLEWHLAFRGHDDDRSVGGPTQTAQISAAVCRQHFDDPLGHDAGQLVPFQIQSTGVVGLEHESAALELCNLAGDPIAVGEGHDVGLALRMICRSHGQRENDGERRLRGPFHTTRSLTAARR